LYWGAPEKSLLGQMPAMRKPLILGLIGGLSVLALGAMAILMSRAEALERLLNAEQIQDLRYDVWEITAEIAWKYFPVGSGIGSFVETYQISEPDNFLSFSYVNHAHNDFLELLLTAGFPGVIILLIAAYAFIRKGLSAFTTPLNKSKDLAFVRLGLTVICLLALGSIADYPLRVPSLSVLWVIAAIWATGSFDNLKARKG
jgi:O-antigen ligase